jgi:hypothetical protein
MARIIPQNCRQRWQDATCPPDVLASLLTELGSATARDAIIRIAATAELACLLSTIESGTSRISSLVETVKEYTYMDRHRREIWPSYHSILMNAVVNLR